MKSFLLDPSLQQLDEKLAPIRKLPALPIPKAGWIRSLRLALGMAGVDLAARLGIAPSSVAAFEESEIAGTVSLNSLRKIASAMDCELVYALVPQSSLATTLERRAEEKADALLDSTSHHSTAREELIQELLSKPSRLWKSQEREPLNEQPPDSSADWSFPL